MYICGQETRRRTLGCAGCVRLETRCSETWRPPRAREALLVTLGIPNPPELDPTGTKYEGGWGGETTWSKF